MRQIRSLAQLEQAIGELEALLFAAARPLTAAAIARRLGLAEGQVDELLEAYRLRLGAVSRGLQLRATGRAYRLETKALHNDMLAAERAERRERPLTAQALEVLAVIALAQPVSTQEVSRTRGAESYAAIETLRRHGLVARDESRGAAVPDTRPAGKATRWRTTQRLLDRLGLKSLAELAQRGTQQTLLDGRDVARQLARASGAAAAEDARG